MLVYKFGGASVKDAEGVRNIGQIINHCVDGKLVVVLSAFGKTTNHLERLLDLAGSNTTRFESEFEKLKDLHYTIIHGLIDNEDHKLFDTVKGLFDILHMNLLSNDFDSYDQKYDQTVSTGELLSTLIVSEYLNTVGINNEWLDVRSVFISDETYREARINWEITQERVNKTFTFDTTGIYLTQGFIAGNQKKQTTTLGREGSDFSAAILGNLLNADYVTIWKDVPGILTADPQHFDAPGKLKEISYQEAVELAYYGAKVIHPKTIKPLENKDISLNVRSFLHPNEEGTIIRRTASFKSKLPIYILKQNQILISVFVKDFSFVLEDGISRILNYMREHRVKVNLIQSSAISFSVCVDKYNDKVQKLIELMNDDFKVLYNEELELITIRHYTPKAIAELTRNREIIVEQKSRSTAHFVLRKL